MNRKLRAFQRILGVPLKQEKYFDQGVYRTFVQACCTKITDFPASQMGCAVFALIRWRHIMNMIHSQRMVGL